MGVGRGEKLIYGCVEGIRYFYERLRGRYILHTGFNGPDGRTAHAASFRQIRLVHADPFADFLDAIFQFNHLRDQLSCLVDCIQYTAY